MSSNCKIERAAGQPSRQSVNLLTATASASAPHSRGDSIQASMTGHLPNCPSHRCLYMIVCIGSINVDFIFAAGRWPAEHEKYRADNYVCASGGSAANTAVDLSRLGRKVTIVGGIGNDDLGNIALRSLINAGVNIDHVIRRSDWKTGCAAIRSMGESKSILTAAIVDPIVVFDSLRTLGVQQGDHLHFSWAPAEEMHDQLRHWRHMGISLVLGNRWSNEHAYRRIDGHHFHE